MAGFFYVLGWAITLIGIGWSFLVASQPIESSAIVITAKLIAMAPGLGIAGSGLIFVAVGAILARLDRLVAGR